jgi:hypothetical protein
MTPKLPPNSWTISDQRQNLLGTSWLQSRKLRHADVLHEIEKQLQLLRDWDNYERQTSPEREAVKAILLEHKNILKGVVLYELDSFL